MNRKFIKCLFMALAVGLMYMPNTAKADEVVRPLPISAQLPQETVKPIPISINQPEGITTNKVDFDVVEADKAPEALMKKINVYKDKEGFVYFRDLTTGNLYVAVMRGEKPTGGYGIEVKSVEDVEGRIIVNVQETDPSKDEVLPQVITNPYAIIKVKTAGYMINVKNLQDHNYSYYDIARDIPIVGVSSTGGTFKAKHEENNFIFIEIQGSDNQTQIFYAPNNEEWKNKINSLKANMHTYVKYALGTPQKNKDKMAMPLNDIVQPVPVLYDSMEYGKKVDVNKEWTVSLNKEVNEKNINSSSVYVIDVNGNKVPVKILLVEKNRVIKISPVEPYKSGQTYNLVITNNIYSNFKGLNLQFAITN